MTDSYIQFDKNGEPRTFSGEDATNLYRAITLKGAIRLYISSGIIPTRGVTITKLLALASEYSKKKYKRKEAWLAVEDLDKWIKAMQAAMPIVGA